MQTHSDPGVEPYGRIWENEPRGGWDAFQAAKRKHLLRLAAETERVNGDVVYVVDWSSLEGRDSEG